MTGYSVDEIRDWNIEGLVQVYNELAKVTSDTNPIFYPIVEVEGTLYGFQPPSKMTVGEYIDLENLTKDIQKNFTDIVAILYRPIVDHKVNSLEFKIKNTWKYVYSNKPENLFKYYTVEKYDSDKRVEYAKGMLQFPANLALGALSFFLLSGTISLKNTQMSSHPDQKLMKKLKMKNLENQFQSIMAGSTHCTSFHKVPSYKSQVISQFSI
jgi:hypothetical protein